MVKWEYCFIKLTAHGSGLLLLDYNYSIVPKGYYIKETYDSRLDLFNYLGGDGWELVDSLGGYTFKRSLSGD